MREYTENDCEQTGYGFSLKGKVVVINIQASSSSAWEGTGRTLTP